MLRRILLLSIVFKLILTNGIQAQGSAGQAGEFLRWGVGAKALGLGRAFTAVADDASALYWNPAGLSSFPRIGGSFTFMHIPLQEGASLNYLGGAIPLRLFFININSTNPIINFIQDVNLGVGMLWHPLGEFELFNDDASRSVDQSQNTINQSAFYFSISHRLNGILRHIQSRGLLSWPKYFRGNLDIGLTTKFVNQGLFGTRGTARSFDVGFKYSHFSGMFNIGFTFRDFNQSTISYNSNIIGDKIPATGVLGFSLMPQIGRMHGLLLAFDYGIIKPSARDRDFMFGLEYDLSVLNPEVPIRLRLGMNSNYESITFGINFSPELILGQDWIPYGDLSYANERGTLDAVGARYSISIDLNPFTAKYWYLRGMTQFLSYECSTLVEIREKKGEILRYFENAELAKNPGKHAYRYEAALRRADLNFLVELGELQNTKADSLYRPKSIRRFKKVSKQYSNRAKNFINKDFGKSEIDQDDYFNSFIYYVQSLLLSGNENMAVEVCADSGRSWGKNLNVFIDRSGKNRIERGEYLNYLYAYSLYKSNSWTDAIKLIQDKLTHSSLAKYLLAHIAFLESNYPQALAYLEEINLNDCQFPKHIYLPITSDRTFGDEILFLKAASIFRISKPLDPKAYIAEFAKIPRFFPNSDLAKFLTTGQAILFKLIDYYDTQDFENLKELSNKMIDSYIRSFSTGTLKKESYTYHYR